MKKFLTLVGLLALCIGAQAGTLTLTPSVSAATVNLTTVGTVDWASWNATNSLTPTNRKSGGGSTISVTDVNTQGSYSNDLRTITWSDGTPNGTGSETAGIYDSTNHRRRVCLHSACRHTTPRVLRISTWLASTRRRHRFRRLFE